MVAVCLVEGLGAQVADLESQGVWIARDGFAEVR